jgi:hypothetical protein
MSETIDRPVCECHGLPMSPNYRGGSTEQQGWRCAEKKRACRRTYYASHRAQENEHRSDRYYQLTGPEMAYRLLRARRDKALKRKQARQLRRETEL